MISAFHDVLMLSRRHVLEFHRKLNVCKKHVPSYFRTHHLPYRTTQGSCMGSRAMSSLSINNKNMHEITFENADWFLSQYDTVMLDCDGVLWKTDHVTPIPGISQTMAKLRKLGKQILFVTNNSIPARYEFVDKFPQYGFTGSFDEVFTVSYAAAVYLKKVLNIKGAVYAIGTSGMEFELKELGLKYYGIGPELDKPTRNNDELLRMKFYDDVEAVLVGFDEYFNYVKMYKAASYLTSESCFYIATNNLEGTILLAPNRRQPITASIVKAVTVAAKREPVLVGKPDPHMLECITAMFPNMDKSRTVMIGDSLKADIAFAKAVGVDSALVLTGSGTLQAVKENPGLEPSYVLQSLALLGPRP